MARRYRMTPRRRAALRKAQLVSARKRRRGSRVVSHVKRNRKKYSTALAIGTAYAAHRATGRAQIRIGREPPKSKRFKDSYGFYGLTTHNKHVGQRFSFVGVRVKSQHLAVTHLTHRKKSLRRIIK